MRLTGVGEAQQVESKVMGISAKCEPMENTRNNTVRQRDTMWDGVKPMEDGRWQHGETQDGTRVGRIVIFVFSHGGHISAANAAAQRRVVAVASSVTVATTAAMTTEARGGVPFAEGPPGFITANQQIGGGAALHTGED